MKLLFLSNFYPPASRGGFEGWCREIAERLTARGHAVRVLTSDFKKADLREPDPAWVHRSLHLEMEIASLRNAFQFFTHRKQREHENLAILKRHVDEFQPDAVLVWGMWNLPRSLAALAEILLPGRVVYYMGDYWPTLPNPFENYWNAPARNPVTGLPKLLLKPFALRILSHEPRADVKLEHILFPTEFMQKEFENQGIRPAFSKVVHGAVDTQPYRELSRVPQRTADLALLFVGRLTEEKGVHTAIRALGHLQRVGNHKLTLTIVGNGEPDYEVRLRQLAKTENVEALVTFVPAQPAEKLPALYQNADIFLFTSIWHEPFGRVIVEAMASGVTVVGARTGGAAEIMCDRENALLFSPGNAKELAENIARLVESPALREQLANAGRRTAVSQFDIEQMADGIETTLQSLVTT